MKKQQQQKGSQQTKKADKLHNFLIIIFGLPCSGKTTYSNNLKQTFEQQNQRKVSHHTQITSKQTQLGQKILIIHGDRVEAILPQIEIQYPDLAELSNQNDTKKYMLCSYKQKQGMANIRKSIVQFYEELSLQKSHQKLSRIKFDPENWKKSRKFIQKTVILLLQNNPEGYSVILEDDLLYRSQRKVFRKISWLFRIPYIEIFMDTNIQQCFQNLKNRKQKMFQKEDIDEDVIFKANQKIQNFINQNCVLKISMNQRLSEDSTNHVNIQIIKSKWQIINIQPNDPNDPYEVHLANSQNNKYTKLKQQENNDKFEDRQNKKTSKQEQIEVAVRRFIGAVMKQGLTAFKNNANTDSLKIFNNGAQLQQLMQQKSQLATVLAKWKKSYVKDPSRSTLKSEMVQHFSNWAMLNYFQP